MSFYCYRFVSESNYKTGAMKDKEIEVIEAIFNKLSIIADYNPQGVLDILQNVLFKNMIFEHYQETFKNHIEDLTIFIKEDLKEKNL